MTIEIDEELLVRAVRARGFASTAAAVDYALRKLVGDLPTREDPLSREESLAMRGSGWNVAPAAVDAGDRPADR